MNADPEKVVGVVVSITRADAFAAVVAAADSTHVLTSARARFDDVNCLYEFVGQISPGMWRYRMHALGCLPAEELVGDIKARAVLSGALTRFFAIGEESA